MSLARLSRRAVRVPPLPQRALHTSVRYLAPQPTAPAGSSTTATQPHPRSGVKAFAASTDSVFTPLDTFRPRHEGPRDKDVQDMLSTLGYKTMEEFIKATVPDSVRIPEYTSRDIAPLSELELRRRAEDIATLNKPMKSYIGMG